MQFLVFFAALLSSTALAQLQSTVNRQCATRYGNRPVAYVRTTTFRATTTRTMARVVTATPRVTRTRAGETVLTTSTRTFSTVTSLPGTTDTYTTSQTYTFTQTTSALARTTTAVTVTTTTTVGATTTVPTPSGFTALADTPGFSRKRNAVIEKREAIEARAGAEKGVLPVIVNKAQTTGGLSARQARNGRQYAIGVQCTSRTTFFRTTTSTRIAATTVTTFLNAATVTRTATVSTTSTATEMAADSTSFVSVSTFTLVTSTSTSTFTQTNTATVTIQQPSATALAQCAANNIVDTAFGGQQIGTLTFNAAFTLQSVNVADTTGVGCCTVCANAGNCAGYAQAPASQGSVCYYVLTDGQCNPASSFGDTFNYYTIDQPGYIIGNAQCGVLEGVAGAPPA